MKQKKHKTKSLSDYFDGLGSQEVDLELELNQSFDQLLQAIESGAIQLPIKEDTDLLPEK
jgi:hypothetical protein